MKVLFVLPGFDLKYNSVSKIIVGLKEYGITPLIICSRSRGLKDTGSSEAYSNYDGVEVFRIVPKSQMLWSLSGEVRTKVDSVLNSRGVDLVVTGTQHSLKINNHIKKAAGCKSLFLLEFIYHKERFFAYSRRPYFGVRALIPLVWSVRLRRLRSCSDGLISCFPGDESRLSRNEYFMPWAVDVSEVPVVRYMDRDNTLIFAGELTTATISANLISALDLVLSSNSVDYIHIVGHGPSSALFRTLKEKYGERIVLFGSLPRLKVLRLISASKYALQPAKLGGWGFMGEALALGTPLICLESNFYNIPDDSYVKIKKFEELDRTIAGLNREPTKLCLISENSREVHREKYSVNVASESLARALESTNKSEASN